MHKKPTKNKNLLFVFKYSQLNVNVNLEIYGDLEDQIRQQVKTMSREIYIDHTYVDFKNSKYEKTFLYEDGWNRLCKLLISTKYGKNASKKQYDSLHQAYESMILAYVYQFLEDLGYDTSNIEVEVKKNTSFITEIYCDIIQNDNYRGKWQDQY